MVTSTESLSGRADLYQSVWNFGVCDKIFMENIYNTYLTGYVRKAEKEIEEDQHCLPKMSFWTCQGNLRNNRIKRKNKGECYKTYGNC